MSNPEMDNYVPSEDYARALLGADLANAFRRYQACLSTSIYDMTREEREADQLKVEAAFKECRELADQILQGGSE